MKAIGNGEGCPFCNMDDLDGKTDTMFVMEEGKDFLKHLTDKHPEQMEKFLFGGESVGI